jgi:hypothetical protein
MIYKKKAKMAPAKPRAPAPAITWPDAAPDEAEALADDVPLAEDPEPEAAAPDPVVEADGVGEDLTIEVMLPL